ncbi:MAG: hypothetical protein AB1346_00815 [Thermodesulfobacteriota bacterium]
MRSPSCRLCAAGLLANLVEGKNPKPVAPIVTPVVQEIVPVDALWGRNAVDTVDALSGRGVFAPGQSKSE